MSVDFLGEAEPRPWVLNDNPTSLQTASWLPGAGDPAIEVAVASAPSRPSASDVRKLWARRRNRRAVPVLLVVTYPYAGKSMVALCGLREEGAKLVTHHVESDIEQLLLDVLEQTDTSAAERSIEPLLEPVEDGQLAGVANEGLFSLHQIRNDTPFHSDYEGATARSRTVRSKRGLALFSGLGWRYRQHASGAVLLSAENNGRVDAIAVVLNADELMQRRSPRFNSVTPVEYGKALADKDRVPWLIVSHGTKLRLYSTNPDVGVGRKGVHETYFEVDVAILDDDYVALLELVFSPSALQPNGIVEGIIARSSEYAVGLGKRLRERVYQQVVPSLATSIANKLESKTVAELDDAYHLSLVVLFRLLFLAYADDRKLLPYGINAEYTHNALKTLAKRLVDVDDSSFDPAATDYWENLRSLWAAIDKGNTQWSIPLYNGGLFDSNPETSFVGGVLAELTLPNSEIGPVLKALLVDVDGGDSGPVDFRSLSVREFGTIYEGLLESSLSRADLDLTVTGADQTYAPAGIEDNVIVAVGEVYLHNKSGNRKATGSYFTKEFAVKHLLDTALEPALTKHLKEITDLIEAGDEAAAASRFFDFRVVDLAMGSGHFLVAAVDRISARFSAFLSEHSMPIIANELTALEEAARENLGDQASTLPIERPTLLRRQIARRCVYGLDINLIAVELARLALWIHTFVPGLPLSSLDHGLVHGNSLTGIGTLDELNEILPSDGLGIFDGPIREALAASVTLQAQASHEAESNAGQAQHVRNLQRQATAAAEPAREIMDAAVIARMKLPGHTTEELEDLKSVLGPREFRAAKRSLAMNLESSLAEIRIALGSSRIALKLAALHPAHFPVLFPEVFNSVDPGFHVILGNPPWEKVKVDRHAFWGLRFPGIRGGTQSQLDSFIEQKLKERPDLLAEYQREVLSTEVLRDALSAGNHPLGSGDIDLYKAFAWRFTDLIRRGGRFGVVLPRTAIQADGTSHWRRHLLEHGSLTDVCTAVNSNQWIFDAVHGQYSVGLVTYALGVEQPSRFSGPFFSLEDYRAESSNAVEFAPQDLLNWSSSVAFPVVPRPASVSVFRKIASKTKIGELDTDALTSLSRSLTPSTDDVSLRKIRPVAEFHATNDKKWLEILL
ncbi:hypothetical protein QN367_16495 [Cryobacterium sp. RTS3]|uniref:Eco57I restriction-modification methylase domain-containing protein n=1 Tax=Cryobacterium sp. RTS3 TaxID=3048643 RepID=UPI002B231A70|nr:hypothetical protein [Cryobacterium sp. RTS3]MEB0000678.1 hypothetical protein [Cryobacterium sp. RTS3]